MIFLFAKETSLLWGRGGVFQSAIRLTIMTKLDCGLWTGLHTKNQPRGVRRHTIETANCLFKLSSTPWIVVLPSVCWTVE